MGNTLYLECQTGISGDMTVAALLDLGADQEVLEKALDSLPLSGYRVEISRVKKSGLDVCDFHVILEEDNHDHDMEYLYDHGAHSHGHGHPQEHATEEHSPGAHAHGRHAHRGMQEILEIIHGGDLTERAKDLAVRIFNIIAQAEAKAHGTTVDQVHFHEVGAVDSIVDVVAAAVCLDNLDVTETIVTEVAEGRGSVRCAHGILTVPVPAVLHIAEASGLPLHTVNRQGELVTPTGAAILAAIMTKTALPERYRVIASGMGAGKREYDPPSILRAMMLQELAGEEEAGSGAEGDFIWKLETNVDDCSGESLGFCMEELLATGARDVYYSPVYMKKNRPAYELKVLCDEEHRRKLENIIFLHTTTIGIRRTRYERTVLPRTSGACETSLGRIRIKCVTLPDGSQRRYPEYEDVASIARERGCSYQEVYAQVKI